MYAISEHFLVNYYLRHWVARVVLGRVFQSVCKVYDWIFMKSGQHIDYVLELQVTS